MNIEADFRDAMRGAGIETDAPIVADSVLHRIHVAGDRGNSKNGWYVLHNDNHPAGRFGCNKRTIDITWRAGSITPLNPQQRAVIEEQRRARAIEQERGYMITADGAGKILRAANSDATEQAYIVRKGVRTFGVNQNCDGVLVVPVYDARTGKLQSLQFIDGEGTKRFLPGGRLSFGCFPLRHTLQSFKEAVERRIGLAEGYATAATLARALGPSIATFAAFSAGNLANVATALREHYPKAEITLFGDNDESGVGQAAAIKAATTVRGLVAIPPTPGTDWNDAQCNLARGAT